MTTDPAWAVAAQAILIGLAANATIITLAYLVDSAARANRRRRAQRPPGPDLTLTPAERTAWERLTRDLGGES